MNTYYDKEMTSDSSVFINYFNKNNVINGDDSVKIESGNDNNFNLICQDENTLELFENNIEEKIKNINNLFLSFDKSYDTKGVIVPI